MSLTLTSHPVQTVAGVVQNIFPGFAPINVVFKREDNEIIEVSENAGFIDITLSGDFSSLINVGQGIYVYSEGLNYTYDTSGTVTNVVYSAPNTTVTIDIPFVETSTGGYTNYRRNYYVEIKLINSTLLFDLLGFSLTNDGTNSGNITIDISLINDKNSLTIPETSQELETGRVKYRFKYREVYDGSANSFTLDDDEIIAVYAAEQPDIEDVFNSFDVPEIYDGYPNMVGLFRSDSNNVSDTPIIKYRELDINQDEVVTLAELYSFGVNDYGYLVAIFNTDDITLNASTKYIEFSAVFEEGPFFDSAFFDPAFFDA